MKVVTISRIKSSNEDDYVAVGISTDGLDIRLKFTLEQYAMLITGMAVVDSPIEVTHRTPVSTSTTDNEHSVSEIAQLQADNKELRSLISKAGFRLVEDYFPVNGLPAEWYLEPVEPSSTEATSTSTVSLKENDHDPAPS